MKSIATCLIAFVFLFSSAWAQLVVKKNAAELMKVDNSGNVTIKSKTTTNEIVIREKGSLGQLAPDDYFLVAADNQGLVKWKKWPTLWEYTQLDENMIYQVIENDFNSDWELIFLPFSDFTGSEVIPNNADRVEVNLGCNCRQVTPDGGFFQFNLLKSPSAVTGDMGALQHGSLHCHRLSDGTALGNSGNFSLAPIHTEGGERGIYLAHRYHPGDLSVKIMGYHVSTNP